MVPDVPWLQAGAAPARRYAGEREAAGSAGRLGVGDRPLPTWLAFTLPQRFLYTFVKYFRNLLRMAGRRMCVGSVAVLCRGRVTDNRGATLMYPVLHLPDIHSPFRLIWIRFHLTLIRLSTNSSRCRWRVGANLLPGLPLCSSPRGSLSPPLLAALPCRPRHCLGQTYASCWRRDCFAIYSVHYDARSLIGLSKHSRPVGRHPRHQPLRACVCVCVFRCACRPKHDEHTHGHLCQDKQSRRYRRGIGAFALH